MNTEIEKLFESTLSSLLTRCNLDQLLDLLRLPPKNHPYITEIVLAIHPYLESLDYKLSHFQRPYIEKLRLCQIIANYEDDLARKLIGKYCPISDGPFAEIEDDFNSPYWSKL